MGSQTGHTVRDLAVFIRKVGIDLIDDRFEGCQDLVIVFGIKVGNCSAVPGQLCHLISIAVYVQGIQFLTAVNDIPGLDQGIFIVLPVIVGVAAAINVMTVIIVIITLILRALSSAFGQSEGRVAVGNKDHILIGNRTQLNAIRGLKSIFPVGTAIGFKAIDGTAETAVIRNACCTHGCNI